MLWGEKSHVPNKWAPLADTTEMGFGRSRKPAASFTATLLINVNHEIWSPGKGRALGRKLMSNTLIYNGCLGGKGRGDLFVECRLNFLTDYQAWVNYFQFLYDICGNYKVLVCALFSDLGTIALRRTNVANSEYRLEEAGTLWQYFTPIYMYTYIYFFKISRLFFIYFFFTGEIM